jgi:hypothetical protein
MKAKWCISIVALCTVLVYPVLAQDVEDNVSGYLTENGTMYLQPLADTFGANINSGLFQSAHIDRFGFHFSIGLVAMVAPVSDEQKTFIAVPEDDFNPPAGTELPTIFGQEEGVEVPGVDEPIPGAWETDWVPLAVPQLTLGSVMGTELTFRWFKTSVDEEVGDIKLFGWGIRHSISQYIPLMPVDIAVGYFRQTFDVGDLVDARASYLGLQASMSIGVLCFYGGLGFESSSLDIAYTYEDEDGEETDVAFELDGKNATRFTIGLALNLPVVKFFVDYSLAKQQTASAGISFGM